MDYFLYECFYWLVGIYISVLKCFRELLYNEMFKVKGKLL